MRNNSHSRTAQIPACVGADPRLHNFARRCDRRSDASPTRALPDSTEVADAAARQTAALGEEADTDPSAQGAVGARRAYAVDGAIEQPAKQFVNAKVIGSLATGRTSSRHGAHFKVKLPPEVNQFFVPWRG